MMQGLVPTIPLIKDEPNIYKTLTNIGWTKHEQSKLKKLNILLIIWTFLIIAVVATDHSVHNALYSLAPLFSADFIQSSRAYIYNDDYYFELEYDRLEGLSHQPVIKGDTFYANILKSMVSLLIPLKDTVISIDATVCRPKPNPPSRASNAIIIFLLFLTYLSAFCQ
ncbi:unnamed protein product, partial [Trichobilharzia regenti]